MAPSWPGGVAAPVRKKCEAPEAAQTGWWFRFKNISVRLLEPPPRPLHQRKLRDICLDVASTPPGQAGRWRGSAKYVLGAEDRGGSPKRPVVNQPVCFAQDGAQKFS